MIELGFWSLFFALVVAAWLALGTQATLPDLSRQQERWSGDFRSFYRPNMVYAQASFARGELPN